MKDRKHVPANLAWQSRPSFNKKPTAKELRMREEIKREILEPDIYADPEAYFKKLTDEWPSSDTKH